MTGLPSFPLKLRGDPEAAARILGVPLDSKVFRFWILYRSWTSPLDYMPFAEIIEIVMPEQWGTMLTRMSRYVRRHPPEGPDPSEWMDWAMPYILGSLKCEIADTTLTTETDMFEDTLASVAMPTGEYSERVRQDTPGKVFDDAQSDSEPKKAAKYSDEGFDEWRHTPAGREISNLFMRFAHQIRKTGKTRFSAEAVINQIRWQQALHSGPDDDGHKINNNWKPYLARWAMKRHKRLEGFFELRNEDKGPGYG